MGGKSLGGYGFIKWFILKGQNIITFTQPGLEYRTAARGALIDPFHLEGISSDGEVEFLQFLRRGCWCPDTQERTHTSHGTPPGDISFFPTRIHIEDTLAFFSPGSYLDGGGAFGKIV